MAGHNSKIIFNGTDMCHALDGVNIWAHRALDLWEDLWEGFYQQFYQKIS